MIGALLAGGAGRRLGPLAAAGPGSAGSKAGVSLAGRPLAAHPAAALAAVCDRVALVAKPGMDIPAIEGVERWDEPEAPRHPLTGIVFALRRAGGPVLVCAADMPFVTPDACRSLLAAAGRAGGAAPPAVIAAAAGRLQPVFGLYAPAALERLVAAAPDAPLTETVEALDPVRVALPPRVLESVNTPEQLAAAEAALGAAA